MEDWGLYLVFQVVYPLVELLMPCSLLPVLDGGWLGGELLLDLLYHVKHEVFQFYHVVICLILLDGGETEVVVVQSEVQFKLETEWVFEHFVNLIQILSLRDNISLGQLVGVQVLLSHTYFLFGLRMEPNQDD